MPQQNYSNHTRFFPLFHFVVIPLLALNSLSHVVRLFMTPTWTLAFWTLLSVTLILLALASRLMALKVQDRVIRLEERMRYKDILSAEIAKRANALPVGQMIALRFASDDELRGLIERVLSGELKTGKEIKLAVRNWRSDHLRV